MTTEKQQAAKQLGVSWAEKCVIENLAPANRSYRRKSLRQAAGTT